MKPPPQLAPAARAAARGPVEPSAWIGRLAALGLVLLLGACSSTQPDKRLLQYLNDSGFGNRYTGNAEEQNYVTIGDAVQITDAYHPGELDATETVDLDGTIVLPVVGAVHVAGLTRSDLEAFLLQKYSPYYEELDISVKIESTTGKFFFVFGEVASEGARPFTGDLTVFQAVMEARPNPRTANSGRVRVIRADPRDPVIIHVNLSEIIESGDSTFNILLQERDIVYVPPTMLAQFGYFLSDLIFPITQVMGELSRALWFWYPGAFGRGYYGNNNNQGIF
jgi:protein involved in polysaccharide export with SLBB domain